jgi:hypothetical protein
MRIDHVSIKGKLLGVWQAFYGGRDSISKKWHAWWATIIPPERKECLTPDTRRLIRSWEPFHQGDQGMQNIKFVVKVNRGARADEYVQRVDPTPIHMTTNRKLALVMGKFTAEDAIKSLQNSHCIPELESVQVSAE